MPMKLATSLSPLAIAGTAALLLADATAIGLDPSVATLVGNGATVAVLVWYVVYDVRTRTPAMLAAFANEQSEIRAAFEKEQSAILASHIQVIDSIRQTFAQEQTLVRQSFAAEQSAQRDLYHREMGEVRSMLFETMKAMRSAVHDVKDTAQTLMSDGGKR